MTSAAQQYASVISNKSTSQTQPLFGREHEMVKNNAGGFTFELDIWTYLNRFLILGSEKNSYYVNSQKLTKDAASNVLKCIQEDGLRTIEETIKISDEGRAVKNDSAIFVMALCLIYGNQETKEKVSLTLDKVCRTGTHLFDFVSIIKQLGKWNSVTKRTISNWYKGKNKNLEFQILKYQQRNGWSHRDVLRLAHVKPVDDYQNKVFNWVTSKTKPYIEYDGLSLIYEYDFLKDNPSEKNAINAIKNHKFTHEMIPRDLLKSPAIWEALLPDMGLMALIRNLGRLSSLGLTKQLSDTTNLIVNKLTDQKLLSKARIHPIFVLSALNTYKQGKGDKGSLTWKINQQICKALEDAFYLSFKYIEPTNKKYMLAIDCSGSMFSYSVVGLNNITAAEASAVMAMAIAKVEQQHFFLGFGHNCCKPLNINANMSLSEVMKEIRTFPWDSTNLSLPMVYATQNNLDVDTFVCFTDNETYAGRIHPTIALSNYRTKLNKPNAKFIVCGTSITNFTVADPKDPFQLDIAGFDSAVPQLIMEFSKGF